MPILECDDLRKTFSDGFEAVRGITFDIAEGEAFGLLGPNGAGKTTTMRMLGTLLTPSGGRATVAGHDVVREAGAVRRAIGFAMQEAGLARYATGREHLLMMGRLYGLSRAGARARADELLTLFGLEEAADRQVRTYSGGMRRRIDLACGLVHKPRLLFLDEPTTGVDPTSRAALWDELRRLQADGVSLFLTTHYLEEADELADRLVIVSRGQVVARGTPAELKATLRGDAVQVEVASADIDRAQALLAAAGAKPETVLDGRTIVARVKDGGRALPGLLAELDGAGIAVERVSVSRPSLDDVYLHYTGRDFTSEDRGG